MPQKQPDMQDLSAKGTVLEKLPFEIKRQGDLDNFEGPITTHYKNTATDEDYLMNWVDNDSAHNRWTFSYASRESLRAYFAGTISLRDLIEKNDQGIVYVIDIDGNIDWMRFVSVPVQNLPEDYLPWPDSFIDLIHCTEYAKELSKRFLDETAG